MTFFEIYALFILPVLVAAFGWGASWFYLRSLKHDETHHPAE